MHPGSRIGAVYLVSVLSGSGFQEVDRGSVGPGRAEPGG